LTQEAQPESRPGQLDFDPARPAASYLSLAIRIIQDPRASFQAMPLAAGYGPPGLFALISFLIPGLIVALVSQNFSAVPIYLMAMGSWLFVTLLIHVVATRLMAGRGPFQATFRVSAYTSFTNLVGWLSVFGVGGAMFGLAASLFGLYLTGQGLAVVHRLSLARAFLALGVVMGFFFILAGSLVRQS